MKAISRYVDNIYYFDKKTNTKKSRHDTVRRDFRRILRANNPAKGLSRAARLLASNYDSMLKRSECGVIFRKHKFISTITEVGTRQNNNIHKELADIFCIQYHQSVKIKNIVYRDGFTIQRTKNSEEILQNPDLFYSQKKEENYRLGGNKFPPRWKKISSKIAYNPDLNSPSSDLDYKLEYKLEEEKRELFELSLFSSSKNISSIEVSEIRAREELEKSPCATGSFDEPAQGEGFLSETKAEVEAGLEPREAQKPETPQSVTVCNQLNKQQYPRLLTAKEEKERHWQRMQRNPENEEESSFAELMSRVLDYAPPEKQTINEAAQEVAKVLRDLEPPLTIQQTQDMKQEQNNEYDEKESRKMLLSKAILNAFGEHSANEMQDNCEFKEITPDKVCIKLAIGVSLNDIEKAKIRKCIQSIYGKNVELVAVKKQRAEIAQRVLNQNEVSVSEVIETLAFLKTFKLENCQEKNKLVVCGSSAFFDILKGFASTEALENAVLNTGISIELKSGEALGQSMTEDAINLTPEKIIEQREWLKNPKTSNLEESIKEFKKN